MLLKSIRTVQATRSVGEVSARTKTNAEMGALGASTSIRAAVRISPSALTVNLPSEDVVAAALKDAEEEGEDTK